jgi:polyisoprenyl-phosphate glycosyltransferase
MKKIKILIPVYNDWKSLFKLLEDIDNQIEKWDADVSTLIINDSSTDQRTKNDLQFRNIKSIKILNMKKNRGHARCNAAGLKYLTEKEDFDYVILMDGDGEDRPEELSLLFNKSKENPHKTVTANRVKRSEGVLFKLLYEIHKVLTYFFTGRLIKFGNYSCLPKEDASKLVKEACIWSSYSGSVTKIISDRVAIPSFRGSRYFGPSQMNLLSLLIHSFSIIAVFKKSAITRSTLFIIIYLFLISSNISIITLFPILAIFVFVLIIFKISYRENIQELNNSLENINSIDVLSNSDSR